MQLIQGGVVDEVGVAGLAARLGVSERHLHRLLVNEVGAGAQQLNQTRRAQVARTLIDQTTMSFTDIAFASGFGSVRQFNDALRAEFGAPPSALRGSSTEARSESLADPELSLRLPIRGPLTWDALRGALAAHAVDGVEAADGKTHSRVVPTLRGEALVTISWPEPGAASLGVRLRLAELSDVLPVMTAVRRWLDLDADPQVIDAALSEDPGLEPLVADRPGLRVPGVVDGAEFALFTVLGQQISLTSARTVQSRLLDEFGLPSRFGAPWRRLDPAVLVDAGPERLRATLRLTSSKAVTLHAVAAEVAGGLDLRPGGDLASTRVRMLAIKGVGQWTTELVAMRALADPDACPVGDLVLARALGIKPGRAVALAAERWRPWRAYATMHLWTKENYL